MFLVTHNVKAKAKVIILLVDWDNLSYTSFLCCKNAIFGPTIEATMLLALSFTDFIYLYKENMHAEICLSDHNGCAAEQKETYIKPYAKRIVAVS